MHYSIDNARELVQPIKGSFRIYREYLGPRLSDGKLKKNFYLDQLVIFFILCTMVQRHGGSPKYMQEIAKKVYAVTGDKDLNQLRSALLIIDIYNDSVEIREVDPNTSQATNGNFFYLKDWLEIVMQRLARH